MSPALTLMPTLGSEPVVEVQAAIRPDSPPSEGAEDEGRIPVSGVEVVGKVAGGVEKKLESVRSSMFRSDMATTNEDGLLLCELGVTRTSQRDLSHMHVFCMRSWQIRKPARSLAEAGGRRTRCDGIW